MMVKEQDDVRLVKSVKEIWTDAQELLHKRMSEPTFRSWIKPCLLIEVANGEAVVAACNDFTRTYLINNHTTVLTEALSQAAGHAVALRVVIDTSLKPDAYTPTIGSITVVPASPQSSEALSTPLQQPSRANLNQKYTFANFVVGSHNRFSHSAAQAVSKSPGQAYNPLFVYGGVGLGKTHLMHAIGNEIIRHSPNLAVRYLSCEKFTNELITSIREDRMIDFRKRYRQIDVLLVDDIQFIQGKESTQEEFFHTFNALRESGRQIVLSSDRPPNAIAKLEERLRSRFEWGMIADVQAPDLETRLAILQKKCAIDNLLVRDDVLEYIASVFTTNIRELEGALIRAHAYLGMGSHMTVSDLAAVLQPGADSVPAKPTLTIEQLIDTVGTYYRVESSEIRSAKRSQDLVLPRHVAMFLAHDLMLMSFPRIGQVFNRKHTSAVHAHKKIKEQLPTDQAMSEAVRKIRRQLGY